MTWKTIIVRQSSYLFLKNNQLHFYQDDEERKGAFPLKDINCVIIEKTQTKISLPLLNALVKANIYVIFCNEKHDPNGVILPFMNYFQPLSVLHLQLEMGKNLKKQMWTRLIKMKIQNQIQVCENLGVDPALIAKQQSLLENLQFNDATNHEGISAHLFFKALYGSSFVRHTDDGINAALNYGYKLLLSALSRTIVKNGLLNYLGIHHIGKTNHFNLASDLMEPFRPLVDYFVSQMGEEIGNSLIYNQRLKLLRLFHTKIQIQAQKHTVLNAIELLIQNFLQTLKQNEIKFFTLPKILKKPETFFVKMKNE